MKRFLFPFLGTIAAVAVASGIAVSSQTALSSGPAVPEEPSSASSETIILPEADASIVEYAMTQPLSRMPGGELLTSEIETKAAEIPQAHAINSVDDITGTYVQLSITALTAESGGYDTGNSTDITRVGTSDTIIIEKFYGNFNPQMKVKAIVNTSQGTISIPTQVVMNDASLGNLSVCATDKSTGNPLRNEAIQGVIDATGKITLTSWWGIYVDAGQYKDRYLYVNSSTTYERANANVRFQIAGDNGLYGYDVRVEQPFDNVLTVKNFANYGLSVDITLNNDSTAKVPQAIVGYTYYNSAVQSLYPISELQLNDSGALSQALYGIVCNKASDNKSISWGSWSLMAPGVVWFGARDNGQLNLLEGTIKYPKNIVANFEGEGTADSPYLIKTAEDLIALSQEINSITDLPETNGYSKYVRAYLGKYFRVENDIDLGATRFTPIGCDWAHVFAGTFDGNNKKISNLQEVTNGTYGYGGLFGHADTVSVIKNVIMVNPKIESTTHTGAVVGWSLGTVENCQVIAPDIYNSGAGTGGVAGLVHKITNCKVSGGTIRGYGGYAGGIAGEIDYTNYSLNRNQFGLIENCAATDMKIYLFATAANQPGGGVTGNLYGANAKNCYFSGRVDASVTLNGTQCASNVGGVAGNLYRGNIENCFAVGDFIVYSMSNTAYSKIGGIVGQCMGNIKDSYVVGRVYGYATKNSGGITGNVQAYIPLGETEPVKSTITNCYASFVGSAETYMINNEKELRELFGQMGNTYSTPDDVENVLTFSNVYYNSDLTNYGDTKYGITTAQMTSATGLAGFSADNWIFTEGYNPRLKVTDPESSAAQMSASAILFPKNSSRFSVQENVTLDAMGATKFYLVDDNSMLVTSGTFANIVNNKTLELGYEPGTEILVVENGGIMYPVELKISPRLFEGEGTQENPYLIQTKADLITLSKASTEKDIRYPGIYFKMTADIDLERDTAFVGICSNNSLTYNRFGGIFDGDNHTIHNMPIQGLVWATAPSADAQGLGTPNTSACKNNRGFIGKLDTDGVLKNIRFAADCNNMVYAASGIAVGYCYGTVENVRNYADLTGVSCYIGGIVGQAVKGSVVRNCYNEGKITTGYMDAAGIVGYGPAIIENCVNTGDIYCTTVSRFQLPSANKYWYAGGIAGGANNGTINNCLNTGYVYAGNRNAGGIVGFGARSGASLVGMKGNLSYGLVEAPEIPELGAIAGSPITTDTLAYNYFDCQITPYGAVNNANIKGTNPTETSVLTSGQPLEGLSADIWDYKAGCYPILKAFADEPRLQAARRIVVTMPTGTSARDLRGNSTLANVDGLTWKLSNNVDFRIEGYTLVGPEKVNSTVSDTLTATFKGIVKVIPFSAQPACPVTGDGTEANPYTINNVDEWSSFVEWRNLMSDDMSGKYVALGADIDFTGKTFVPMSTVANPWNGTFDGCNKKVSGINATANATYYAPFIQVNSNGVIKNLTLGGKISSAYSYVGGFAGYFYGTIENCVSEMAISSTAASKGYFGGFAAYAYAGSNFTDCVFKGSLTSAYTYLGGIAAYGVENITFTRCGFEGNITSTYTGAVYAAGIAGCTYQSTFTDCYSKGTYSMATGSTTVSGIVAYANGKANAGEYKFNNCWNESDITAKTNVGGIVAFTGATPANNKIIAHNCYNTGSIHGNSSTAVSSTATAGLFAFYPAGSEFYDCYNSGDITNDMCIYTAGVAGYYKGSGSATVKTLFKRCYNIGEIKGLGNQGAGVIAYMTSYVTADSCYNTGEIKGGMMVGGIASAVSANCVVSNCWNSGKITGINQAGGIASWGTANTAKVINCWNSGDVECTALGGATSTTVANGYQAGGLLARASLTIENCYNTGNITGAARIGGLVGLPTKGNKNATSGVITPNTTIRNSYNAGRVTARQQGPDGEIIEVSDTCGYIIGTNPNDMSTKAVWTEYNICENVYYLTDVNTATTLASPGIGVTTAELCNINMGAGWTTVDKYCIPVLTSVCNDNAIVNSIRIVAPDDASTNPLTSSKFFIGNPEGTTWAINPTVVEINGNEVIFNKPYNGELLLTATLGKAQKTLNLDCNVTTVGIDEINDGREIESEVWYNLAGVQVQKPANNDGQVYIVTLRYTDGTSATLKVLNR